MGREHHQPALRRGGRRWRRRGRRRRRCRARSAARRAATAPPGWRPAGPAPGGGAGPAESKRQGQSASAARPKRSSAGTDRAAAAHAGPEGQCLRHCQRRLHRVVMADEMQPRPMRRRVVAHGHAVPGEACRPPPASARPCSRSRLDLPLPLGPVSTSAPPGASAKSRPAKISRSPRRQARPLAAKPRAGRSGDGEAGMPAGWERRAGDHATAGRARRAKKTTAPVGDNRGRLMKRSGEDRCYGRRRAD